MSEHIPLNLKVEGENGSDAWKTGIFFSFTTYHRYLLLGGNLFLIQHISQMFIVGWNHLIIKVTMESLIVNTCYLFSNSKIQ